METTTDLWRFNHLSLALQYRALCSGTQFVLRDTAGQFLVARPYIAAQLHQLGYEYLRVAA